MTKKKKEVGKGIRALLSNIENSSTPEARQNKLKELSSNAAYVPVSSIETNPFQPRKEFDTEELMELAKSIKVHGLIQPVTLRALGDNKFQLIAGERRLRASKMAGIKEVPAYIRVANDQEMLEMALVENIQRSNLNAIEVAISYQRLMEECELTHEELSNRVGKNRSTVTNYVRLLKLPPAVQSGIKDQKISMGHARVLAGMEEVEAKLDLYREVLSNGLSVRATEALAKFYQSKDKKKIPSPSTISSLPAEMLKIKDHLSGVFGSKVDIKRDNNGKGQIVIKFNSDKEFNNLIDILDGLD